MDVSSVAAPVVEGAGLELVEAVFVKESGRHVLRVTVDRDGGVDLDTIATVTEKLSRRLDLEDFSSGPYSLEVSSPGIERPLKRPQHFRRVIGQQVKVRTVEQVDGASNFKGVLTSADDDAFVIATDAGEIRLGFDQVASARTVADWDAELKKRRTG